MTKLIYAALAVAFSASHTQAFWLGEASYYTGIRRMNPSPSENLTRNWAWG